MINVCTWELYEKDNELIVFLNDAILDLFGFLPSQGSRWPQSVSLNKWTFNGCLSANQVERGKHLSREGRKKKTKKKKNWSCCLFIWDILLQNGYWTRKTKAVTMLKSLEALFKICRSQNPHPSIWEHFIPWVAINSEDKKG